MTNQDISNTHIPNDIEIIEETLKIEYIDVQNTEVILPCAKHHF